MPHGATSQPHNNNNTQSCFPALPARSQTSLRALRSIQITVTCLLAADGSDEDSDQEGYQDSDKEWFLADSVRVL